MKHRIPAALALACLIIIPSIAASQTQTRGQGFGIGGVLLPSGSPTVLATTRLGENLALELGVALRVSSDDSDDQTDFGVGFGLRRLWNTEERFQPYVGGRVNVTHTSRTVREEKHDDTKFGLMGVLGGEYFVMRNLSLLGEVGLGLFFGSFELNTGTRLAAFLYL